VLDEMGVFDEERERKGEAVRGMNGAAAR